MKPHKHAELIKAWADGAEIQYWHPIWQKWVMTDDSWMLWADTNMFRINPDKKPDVVEEAYVMKRISGEVYVCQGFHEIPNTRFVWDGETGKLKSAEVIG